MTHSVRWIEGDVARAADWRWPNETLAIWTESERTGSEAWHGGYELTTEGWLTLLQHFGLSGLERDFPIETVAALSPEELHEHGQKLARAMARP
ncbi:MAG TPA: hypothetical protein VN495_03600 [Candidatus Paceibacterota bacterium]|nr:hypothetical protein [Candidatus Paceibacterota bacterium]